MRQTSVYWSFPRTGEATPIVWNYRLADGDKEQKGSAEIAWSSLWHLARYLPNLFPQIFNQGISAVFLQKHFHCFALFSKTFSQCAFWISFAAVCVYHIRQVLKGTWNRISCLSPTSLHNFLHIYINIFSQSSLPYHRESHFSFLLIVQASFRNS